MTDILTGDFNVWLPRLDAVVGDAGCDWRDGPDLTRQLMVMDLVAPSKRFRPFVLVNCGGGKKSSSANSTKLGQSNSTPSLYKIQSPTIVEAADSDAADD